MFNCLVKNTSILGQERWFLQYKKHWLLLQRTQVPSIHMVDKDYGFRLQSKSTSSFGPLDQ